MKKFAKKFLGIAVAAALLTNLAMPTVAVMAHSHHGVDAGETKLAEPAAPNYTITLTKPKGVTVEESAAYGAYQIFSGNVPEEPEDVTGSKYDKDNGGYQNPGDEYAKLPITDIRWGNAFGEVDSDTWKQNVIKFVIALGTAKGGAYDYAFHNFDGFDGLVEEVGGEKYLAAKYVDGSYNVNGESTDNIDKVKYDKLAITVAQIIEAHPNREWLQAFSDILGGYVNTGEGKYKEGNYVKQFYGGTWNAAKDKYEITVPVGYYMIIDQTNVEEAEEAYSARMLFVSNDVTQTLKEDVPKLNKQIDRGAEGYHYTEAAGVGDVVNFRLTGTLPSNYDNYIGGYQYKFVDTLSKGLTLDNVEKDAGDDGNLDVTITVKAKGLFKWDGGTKWDWDKDAEVTIPVDYTDYSASGIPLDNHHHVDTYNYKATKTEETDTKVDVLTVEFPCLREIIVEKDGSYYRLGYSGADTGTDFGSSRIYVDYSATVNSDAVIFPKEDDALNGNTNTAVLTYSDNPQSYADTDETNEHRATVYTFGLDIVKVNAAEFLKNDGNLEGAEVKLAGAEFVLVRKNPKFVSLIETPGEKEYQIAKFKHIDPTSTGTFKDVPYESIDSWEGFDVTKKADEPTPEELQTAIDTYLATAGEGYKVTSDENGAINISGLDAGVTYTMVETKTPSDEYAKIDPFDITLTAEMSGDEYTGKLDNATSDEEVGEGESFSLKKYVDIIDPEKVGSAATQKADDNGSANMLVANFKYVDLPSTGGIGIYPFYIIGGIGIAASAVLFALSKRKKTA